MEGDEYLCPWTVPLFILQHTWYANTIHLSDTTVDSNFSLTNLHGFVLIIRFD